MRRLASIVLSAFALGALGSSSVDAQTPEVVVVDSANAVLNELMQIPVRGIPASLLDKAQGIVIVPGALKGGFIVGVRWGRGVLLTRDEAGNWRPPTFITLAGGSVGWQLGVQATDVILVFKTVRSVKGLMKGKFTLGADAAVAAGPVGRQAEAATDVTLKAEILSYSRSRGLFAGVALDGSVLSVDSAASAAYYSGTGGVPPPMPGPLPMSAITLLQTVGHCAGAPANLVVATATAAPAAPVAPQMPAPPVVVDKRRQLAESATRLNAVLDAKWQAYLALPPEIFSPDRPIEAAAVAAARGRFETVAADPRYQSLTTRPEFQATYELLRRF
jgi:SH3 domain-containing YSC84-like protein 1